MKRFVCKITFTFLLSLVLTFQGHAHSNLEDSTHLENDTIKKPVVLLVSPEPVNGALLNNSTDDLVESNLLNGDNYTVKTKSDIRALFHFLKSTRLRNASRDKRISYRLYFGLAKTFVRMKLYPQAMQCYYQTLLISGEKVNNDSGRPQSEKDSTGSFLDDANALVSTIIPPSADNSQINPQSLTNAFDYLKDNDTSLEKYLPQSKASIPVSNESIIETYNDGQEGTAYAIVLHVKQPVPGKRRPFAGINNVGHFFITLIKYNAGAAYVTRSFGFYPAKESFFAATPIHPASDPSLKDDALHDWDEAIGKFISRRRFEKIIRLIDHYNSRSYHLNKNNCTDFGLYAAAIAGVSISNTKGTWPLGRGNNPANAGQSILEGKILNTDTGNKQDLFTCNNVNGKRENIPAANH